MDAHAIQSGGLRAARIRIRYPQGCCSRSNRSRSEAYRNLATASVSK